MSTEEQKRKHNKVLKVLGALMGVFLLIGCCSVAGLAFLGTKPTATPPAAASPTAMALPTSTTSAPTPTTMATPKPTRIPIPTVVVMLEGVFAPGTYIVSKDLQPGTYRGQAGERSCYWARLSGLSGELGDIIANDNAKGQFYIEVKESDFALVTACRIERMSD